MQSMITKNMGGTYLVSGEFGLDVVFKGTVALVLVLDESAELFRELLKVIQVVDTETGAGSLGRVGWANSLAGGSNANNHGNIKERWACECECVSDGL